MKIYSYNIIEANEKELTEWFAQMSEERKEAVKKLRVPHKQKLKIVADYLCRKAIAEHCNVDPHGLEFGISEHGKPYVKGLDVHFSISHSGELAVCAVSDKEIGIDIEKIREINCDISKRFACENEIRHIEETENGFFEIWTLKEAYFKCIGTGLGSDIKNVSFEISNSSITCSENGFACYFSDIHPDYICSVCENIF